MKNTHHLLIVDDDQAIREDLRDFFSRYAYNISTVGDGVEMFEALKSQAIDLIILDVMLPGDDGFTLCKKIRNDSEIPIIMLTAIGEATDRIVGLEIGADDYLTKPFTPHELLARVKAIIRRSHQGNSQGRKETTAIKQKQFAGWALDLSKRQLLAPDNVEVSLTTGEYDLLNALLDHPHRMLSRDQLLDITKNRPAAPFDRSIDIQISRLRQKIEEDPKNPELIKTVRNVGYVFTADVKIL